LVWLCEIFDKKMINLLTPETKKKLTREEREREILIALGLLFVLLLVAFTFNFALWLNFRIQTQTMVIINPVPTGAVNLQTAEETRANQQIKQLSTWWPKESWYYLLSELQTTKPATIKLARLVGELRASGLILAIAGESTNRQELANFAEELKKSQSFSRVDLPLNDLLAGEKSRFTLNLEVANHD